MTCLSKSIMQGIILFCIWMISQKPFLNNYKCWEFHCVWVLFVCLFVKQNLLYHSFVEQKTGSTLIDSLFKVTQDEWAVRLTSSLEALECNYTLLVVGNTQLLMFVKLRSPFSCWLTVRNCSQLLKASLQFWHVVLSSSSQRYCIDFSCALNISN